MWNHQADESRKQPMIVQGTVVPNPQPPPPQQVQYAQQYEQPQAPSPPDYNPMNIEAGNADYGGKGVPQGPKFNDVAFAILFVLHIVVAIGFGAYLAVAPIEQQQGGDNNGGGGGGDYFGLATHATVCGFVGVSLSTVMLGFMMKFARQLVKTALLFSVVVSGLVCVASLLSGQMLSAIMGLLFFAINVCYTMMVWSTIPFAAANLNTACTAIKTNLGLAVVGYVCLVLALAWTVSWSLAVNLAVSAYGSGLLFLYFLSFYWTHQVIMNTVHVTTAGVVGTWWFTPSEASSCCSPAITSSFKRATTYSFGSICLGSLIVAVVQTLRQMNHYARDQDDCQILVCLIDCILGCIEDILEFLNKWAYTYVGLYGYSYIEAGRNVFTLFQHKGWTSIVADSLVDNVLFMVSLVVGLVVGLVGLVVAKMDESLLVDFGGENVGTFGFILGFLIGYVFCSVLLGLVSSAVNTVIVCFAEAPNEFQNNYPELSMEMRQAWREAYPEECGGL